MPDFSRETKEALSVLPVRGAAARKAELAALIAGIGQMDIADDGRLTLFLQSENLSAVRRGDYLLRALGGKGVQVSSFRGAGQKSSVYTVWLREPQSLKKLLHETGYLSGRGVLKEPEVASPEGLLKNEEALKGFLRGVFLSCGYLGDPEQHYHMEFAVRSRERAEELQGVLAKLGIRGRITLRKGSELVYLKDSGAISDVLSLMGAVKSRLEWENVRILRGMKGQINRQVNCETANLEKAGRAGTAQVEAIRRIMDRGGFRELPAHLQEIARLRLSHPEASLQELGEWLDPPIGRSGVNHRLRKLMEIAEEG